MTILNGRKRGVKVTGSPRTRSKRVIFASASSYKAPRMLTRLGSAVGTAVLVGGLVPAGPAAAAPPVPRRGRSMPSAEPYSSSIRPKIGALVPLGKAQEVVPLEAPAVPIALVVAARCRRRRVRATIQVTCKVRTGWRTPPQASRPVLVLRRLPSSMPTTIRTLLPTSPPIGPV